ncbi:MAG: hypothetical protein RXN31_00580 [Candidatus Nanopusillus acidilobi]
MDDATCSTLRGVNAITYENKMNCTNAIVEIINISFKRYSKKLAVISSIFFFIVR